MRISSLHTVLGICLWCCLFDLAVGKSRKAVKAAGPSRVGFRRGLWGISQMGRETSGKKFVGGKKEPNRGAGRNELRG